MEEKGGKGPASLIIMERKIMCMCIFITLKLC